MRDAFRHVADRITAAVGTPWAMLLAVGVVALWAVSGPVFGFSDTWQLAINTGTTVVTFLMVFVIQASQNREARATQLKLDELIDVEDASDVVVELHQRHFQQLLDAAEASDPDVLNDVQVRRKRPARQPKARHASS